MDPFFLKPSIQHYDWGERGKSAFIPNLLGIRPKIGVPYAELWIGAHPFSPSIVKSTGQTLDRLIRSDPAKFLGAGAARKFRGELPFLLKVISAEKGLSIQVHPNETQASEGLKREKNIRNLKLRNYRDPHAKFETIIALEDFYLLAGFQPLSLILSQWRKIPELRAAIPPGAINLKSLYRRLMTMNQSEVDSLLAPLVRRLKNGPWRPKTSREHWFLKADRERCSLGPKDRGLFSFFLLNLVRLKSYQASLIAPGEPHAHLEGRGIEVMSNSDNVVRGGLTSKHVDVSELLKICNFEAHKPRIHRRSGEGFFQVPIPHCRVRFFQGAGRWDLDRPQVLLSLKGEAQIESGTFRSRLLRGQSVFVPAASLP